MKNVLLDTNVVLDALLNRLPWATAAHAIWQAAEASTLTCSITANSITDIYFISRRVIGNDPARLAITQILTAFSICPVDRTALVLADSLAGPDFEDNVQIACATLAHLDAIVTRDKTGFLEAVIPVYTPAEFVALLP